MYSMRKLITVLLFGLLLCVTGAMAEEAMPFEERLAIQAEIEASLEAEMAEGGYTLENPLVVVDPYNETPLTAMVLFETESPARVTITVQGKDEFTSLSHSFNEMQTLHKVPVYGLYADYANQVTLTLTDSSGTVQEATLTIETEALPADFSTATVSVSVPEKMAEGLTFFDCPHYNGNYALAIDANGDVRWYMTDKTLNCSVMMAYLDNGNLLVSSGKIIPDTYNNLYSVYELSPLGKFSNEYEVYGIHHDIREKANGNLIFAASKEGRESQNDYIVEIDRETGEQVNAWDLMEIIPMTAYDTQPPYSGGLSNWLHNNAVWYIEEEDAFIISGRHQNVIAKFSADGTLQWAISATIGDLNENVAPYLLTPMDEDFEYTTSQHAAMQMPDGRIMAFDNRNFMDMPAEGEALDQKKLYSRAVIYSIDVENMTVTEDWSYGKERPEIYSSFVSDVDYLGENHYLIDFGGRYVSEDGENYDHMFTDKETKNNSIRTSVVVEILDDEVIFEAELGGSANANSYKAERHNIYQNAQEVSW